MIPVVVSSGDSPVDRVFEGCDSLYPLAELLNENENRRNRQVMRNRSKRKRASLPANMVIFSISENSP